MTKTEEGYTYKGWLLLPDYYCGGLLRRGWHLFPPGAPDGSRFLKAVGTLEQAREFIDSRPDINELTGKPTS